VALLRCAKIWYNLFGDKMPVAIVAVRLENVVCVYDIIGLLYDDYCLEVILCEN